jgi:amino acid adenylation domain-containing protein
MIQANTVLEVFAKRVKEHPDKLALKFRDIGLTYAQLDELSNRIANFLIAKGITTETLVPICVHRPLDMVIGIWGIIKTGAAYVPIDAEFPEDRIKYMIDDTGAKLVVSDSLTTRFLSAAESKEIVLADDDWKVVQNSPATAPDAKVSKDNVCYVIYTSGSTGKPKGVLIEHKSIIDYIGGLFDRLPYEECRSFALGVSFAADSVITHLFGALMFGKELHVFFKEDYNNVEYIHDYFDTHGIDAMKIVPSHWKSLALNGKELLPNKILMFGGEALYAAMIKDIIPAANRKCILINHYGPTETTVGQLLTEINEATEYGHIIPIGKPFTDAVVYILDESGNPVEGDNTGEIFIGGTCVARGYLNRPDLTEQRFVPNKFSKEKGARLYRTGDLARFLPNGDVEYLGRVDDQVKIRGYRIELGEIENVLGKAAGVKQAAVLAQMGSNGDMRLIGYVVCPDGYHKQAIVTHLEEQLPQYMVPQLIVPMDAFPHFPNGKLDKKALPNPDASTLLTNEYIAPVNKTETIVSDLWKEILDVQRAGVDDNFFELGGNSLLGLKFIALLKTRHSLVLPVAKLYQYPKIKDLAAFLDGKAAVKKIRKRSKAANADVAIIGMSGRFPGANSIAEFWDNLKNGRETTTFFEDHELDANIPHSIRNNPNYVKARGIVSDVKGFDAAFFGIPPTSAELMDPQQRIFFEIAWEAMENAGYAPSKYDGSIGVFAGVRFNTYYANNVIPNDELVENVGRFQIITLNDKDYVASRAAYTLDLKGPAVNVQSACSTSLLAVAQAVQSIRDGQCDMALAGGATINAPVNVGHLYDEGAMLSNDGHCRPFDAEAKGTVFSDGAGVVLLKNKEEAIKDGDNIIAVIKGVGLSNDGGAKGSFTAPSAEGQAAAISMAIDDAGVDPADISYIETHGTATPLGDPIEIEGLNIAFGDQDKKQYCTIGSVKSNFGHLTAASGIAGLIKASLALHNKQLPPSINYDKPNPHIDFENSPFFVNNKLNDWDSDKNRIAGVSSFGVGGTNVHVVLAEAEEQPATETTPSRPAQLITWSAKSEKSLDLFGEKLSDYLRSNEVDLADVAFTLNTTREDFNHRRFVVANNASDFIEKARSAQNKTVKGSSQDIVFMFPGQGDQYLNMGKALYDTEKVFKDAMDECAAFLKAELKENILDIIYPAEITPEAEQKLRNTGYSQPALFSIGYALGKLWMSWGIFPTAFVGHSIGEFVSAYFAGIFSLEDALKLIATRGRMMADMPEGSMLSVRVPVEEIKPYLSVDIALAAANSPQLCVVAGTDEAIGKLSIELTEKGVLNRLLSTSHAFHSHMMDDVVAPFEEVVKTIKLHEPLIPITSTVTGERLRPEDATDPHYWAKHLRLTVLFGTAMQELIDEGHTLFLELGPANSASTLTRQQAAGKPINVISTLDKAETGDASYQSILKALGQLWQNGIEPDWKLFYKDETRRRLADLPTYAFNKQDYWVEPPARQQFAMPVLQPVAQPISAPERIDPSPVMRKQELIRKVTETLENASGIELGNVAPDMSFIEMGLDSLLLTQVAIQLKRQFSLPITFRQLNEELGTLELLASYLDEKLPADAIQTYQAPIQANIPQFNGGSNPATLDVISQQLQLLAMQVATLQNGQAPVHANGHVQSPKAVQAPVAKPANGATLELSAEEQVEIKKPFGAIARIEKQSAALTDGQQKYLAAFTEKYNEKTKGSKSYTQEARPYMADPRVVSGFRPATKELVYNIVIEKSKGSRLWDIDGNEYIDALNGFGSNMLGYQPDFLVKALKDQIDNGYEIGPQHVLAAEVCKLVCEFTNFDRAALCNTGSEAVLGAMRISRTVTGRSLIVAFAGSYHGITDEVIARGSKKLKTYPAAPGIMPEAVQNMLILDYGTDESLQIIKERGHEIAAVLVEPVQSRRADFQPIEFLKKLREITKETETILVFDEVISGFRFHPGGVQAMWGIKADLGTYGKVAGGGLSVGIIAGERRFMDALDGGFWQFGDNSVPEVGVTYFAGTFVRHPLVLAAAKASLNYLKEQGPQLQENLNAKTAYIANSINSMFRRLKVPMYVASYGSLYRIKFLEEYPYLELFFVLMRLKGIHILEGFPCFLTTSHSDEDIKKILTCFEESLTELKAEGLIPDYEHPAIDENESLNVPPVPGAKLGKDKEGNPAWFIKDEKNPGRYLQVSS